MEATVEKLEVMFSKSEADLDVIEKRLKLEQFDLAAEKGFSYKDSAVGMLERLKAIKDKHCVLHTQMTEVAAAQKTSMVSIQDKLKKIIALNQHIQQTTGVEDHCVPESAQKLEELLVNRVG